MSHCCNNGPVTVKVYPNAPAVCPDTPEYLFENDNLSGVGVFSEASGTNILFRGIASSGGTIDVTLDAVNKTVNVELDADIVAGNFPDATTVIKGKTAYSTNAEALAKASTTKAVTPSNFAAMEASTTFSGLSERSTDAEALTGTSTAVVLTPSNLKYVTDRMLVTQVVANQGAREAAAPSAAGQLLYQRDTGVLYAADTTDPGDWTLAAIPRYGPVLLQGDVSIQGSAEWDFQTKLETSAVLNFDVTGGSLLHRNDVLIPANQVLVTGGTAGQLSYSPATNFVSGYAVETYLLNAYSTTRTLDGGTATLPDVINVLCTLIADLADTKKPQFI